MSAGQLLQMSGVVVDLIYRVDSLPRPGDQVLASTFTIAAGGGFNAMISAKRAGMDVTYGGAHGTGLLADMVRRDLTDVGIPLLQARSKIADQGSCVVIVDRDSERTFLSKEGAEGFLEPDMLSGIHNTDFGWALLSGYGLAYAGSREALGGWIEALPDGVGFIFDPGPLVGQIPAPLLTRALARAQWTSANAAEATAITGESDPETAVEALSNALGTEGRGAVVRCGDAGCWISARGRSPVLIPQFAVDTIDTNGAGDAHVGAFVAALSSGADAEAAAEYANAAAALSTTSPTATSSHSDDAVRELLSRRAAKRPGPSAAQSDHVLVPFPAKRQ